MHLRPTEQEKSAGPEVAAGTELAVLAQGSLSRKGLPIYRVKVQASPLSGYVFLSESELGPECPLIWPNPEYQKKNEPQDTEVDDGRERCTRKGTFKEHKQIFDPGCTEAHGKPKAAEYTLDVDGDGRVDELLNYADELALARHTAAGWTPLLLSRGINTEHHDGTAAWLAPIHAGDALYLVSSYHEQSTFEDTEPENVSAYTLYRIRLDGKVFEVLKDSADTAELKREFRGNADGSIIISDGKGRAQTLRWDASLYRFVP